MTQQQSAQQQTGGKQNVPFALPAKLPFGPDIVDRDIFELLGLKDIGDKDRAEMLTVIMDTIYNRVIARILDNFNVEEQKELEKALGKKDLKKVNEMLAGKELSDYMTLLAEETVLYKVQLAAMFAPKAA